MGYSLTLYCLQVQLIVFILTKRMPRVRHSLLEMIAIIGKHKAEIGIYAYILGMLYI